MSEMPNDITGIANQCAFRIYAEDCKGWFDARDIVSAAILAERELCVSKLTDKAKSAGFLSIDDIEQTIRGEG